MTIVIEAGQLIDGTGSEPVRDAAVVIDGDRISYAGPAAGAEYPPEATIIRTPNGTVMPGLIDVHVHITNDGGPGAAKAVLDDALADPARLALIGAGNAATSLRAGYTTLRNLHAPLYVDLALRDAIADGRVPGSRLVCCGQGLCITGGHMDKSRLPNHVSVHGRVGVCDTPDGFRQAVRQHVKAGVDLIKINSDVGSRHDETAPYRQEMSTAEMTAACDEAHRFGLRVAAHTTGGKPIEEALRAGVDTIEHGHWLTDRAIELMLERGAYYVPTLIVNTKNFAYSPEELGMTEQSLRWCRLAYEAKWDSLARANRAGVKIAAGSDAGFLVHHGENAEELVELVKGGLTPMEAIRAATATAAELLQLDHQLGTLSAGKLADIIVVAGDPLADIATLQSTERISHVLKAGRIAKSPNLPAA